MTQIKYETYFFIAFINKTRKKLHCNMKAQIRTYLCVNIVLPPNCSNRVLFLACDGRRRGDPNGSSGCLIRTFKANATWIKSLVSD